MLSLKLFSHFFPLFVVPEVVFPFPLLCLISFPCFRVIHFSPKVCWAKNFTSERDVYSEKLVFFPNVSRGGEALQWSRFFTLPLSQCYGKKGGAGSQWASFTLALSHSDPEYVPLPCKMCLPYLNFSCGFCPFLNKNFIWPQISGLSLGENMGSFL